QTARVAVGTSGPVELAGDLKAKGTACYADIAGKSLPPYDPAAAKRLLDQDGWVAGPDGVRVKNGKRLSLTVITEPEQAATLPATSEYMAQQWKAIGVQVKIVQVTENALVADLYQT